VLLCFAFRWWTCCWAHRIGWTVCLSNAGCCTYPALELHHHAESDDHNVFPAFLQLSTSTVSSRHPGYGDRNHSWRITCLRLIATFTTAERLPRQDELSHDKINTHLCHHHHFVSRLSKVRNQPCSTHRPAPLISAVLGRFPPEKFQKNSCRPTHSQPAFMNRPPPPSPSITPLPG
jgi:hypothetical protein